MRGFKMIIDFLNYSFFLVLVVFIILYIIVGDRMDIFTNIAKTLVPISYFIGMFLLAFKFDQDKFEKFRKEDKLDEIIIYFSRLDSIKDIIVIIILPVLIIFVGLIEEIIITDIIQAVTAFILMYFWHLIIFMKKDDMAGIQFMTNFDKIKDKVVIFLLPIVIVSIPLGSGFIETIDIFQAFTAFVLMYSWRKIMLLNAK